MIVVQPLQVRQFAKAQGILAKTDKIDARLIAMFGKILEPDIRPMPSKKIGLIRDLLARKRQLNEARTQKLNHQHKAPKVLAAFHRRLLKVLDKEIAWVNDKLAQEVAEVTEWRRTYDILGSVPGIGDGVAFTLLGKLLELGTLSNQQVAAMKDFYQKLVAQGKHKKVALTACMRKMITILNTMVRNIQEWQMN